MDEQAAPEPQVADTESIKLSKTLLLTCCCLIRSVIAIVLDLRAFYSMNPVCGWDHKEWGMHTRTFTTLTGVVSHWPHRWKAWKTLVRNVKMLFNMLPMRGKDFFPSTDFSLYICMLFFPCKLKFWKCVWWWNFYLLLYLVWLVQAIVPPPPPPQLIKASCTHCNLFAERNSKKREEKVKVIAVPAVNLLSLSPSHSPQSFVDIFLKINLAIISAVRKWLCL